MMIKSALSSVLAWKLITMLLIFIGADEEYESSSWWTERLHVAPSPSLPTLLYFPSACSPGPPAKPAGKSPPLKAPCPTYSPLTSSPRTPAWYRTLPQTLAPHSRQETKGSSRSSPAPAGVSLRRVERVPQPLQVWRPPFSHLPTGTPGPSQMTKPHTSGSTPMWLLGSPHPVPPRGEPLLQWWGAQRFDRAAAGSRMGCGDFRRRPARFCWRRWSASPTCRQWRRRGREGRPVWQRCRYDGNAWGRGEPSHNLNKKNRIEFIYIE